MADKIPLQVTIRVDNKRLVYPRFNQLPAIQADAAEKSPIYYDRTSDCKTDSAHSPAGVMYAIKFVSPALAAQAVAQFGSDVKVLTDAQAEDFWHNRAMVNVPENNVNTDILTGLESELSLKESLGQDTTALKAKIAKAIDPDDTEPGIKRNPDKTYSGFKTRRGYTIVSL